MAFNVTKRVAGDLSSIGAKLGGQSSFAVQAGSAISMASSSLSGEAFAPAIYEASKSDAAVQSGMSSNPKMGPR